MRAKALADEIGSWHLDVSIDGVVSALLSLFQTLTGKRPRYKVKQGLPLFSLFVSLLPSLFLVNLSIYVFIHLQLQTGRTNPRSRAICLDGTSAMLSWLGKKSSLYAFDPVHENSDHQ